MAHTHEFDCAQCGAHFDDKDHLDRHNKDKHPRAETRDGSATPRYGSAGSGGAEFEPGPERD